MYASMRVRACAYTGVDEKENEHQDSTVGSPASALAHEIPAGAATEPTLPGSLCPPTTTIPTLLSLLLERQATALQRSRFRRDDALCVEHGLDTAVA